MKITKETKISKILEEKPGAVGILIRTGMHCIGCPMMAQETLEQGCLAHGMTKKQIDELIKELNNNLFQKRLEEQIDTVICLDKSENKK